jgi:hypothetical protein
MFLGTYRIEGDATQLTQAYERLLATLPQSGLKLHVCVPDEGGLWIFDTCPTRADFVAFAASTELRDAMKWAGLPPPQVVPVGDVHAAFVGGERISLA